MLVVLLRSSYEWSKKLPFFFRLGLIGATVSGCAGKFPDVEELINGNRLLKSSVSTLNGATEEAARAKAEQEADKICQYEGRTTVIKNITTTPNPITGLINTEIEFDCAPKNYPRSSR